MYESIIYFDELDKISEAYKGLEMNEQPFILQINHKVFYIKIIIFQE